jgi:hypothetical protein
MRLTSVSAAATILANAMKVLDSVREQAKGSRDLALKENISKLYSEMLDLRAAQMRIEEENAELRRTMAHAAEKPEPEIRTVGLVNYYFVGKVGPYCQPCYDVDPKVKRLVMVTPPESWNGGQRRHCPVCHSYFQETKSESGQIRLGGRRGGGQWS